MSVQEVNSLRQQRDEAQLDLEQECRDTFLPGMKVVYPHGGKKVAVEVIGPDEEADYMCWVRNLKTGGERKIRYEDIIEIVVTRGDDWDVRSGER